MATSEIFFSLERDFMAWRVENPEMWAALVVAFLALVVSLCAFWYVCERHNRIQAAKVARRRKREREAIKMNGGL